MIRSGEDPLDVEQISGQQWLARWMNQQCGKGLSDDIDLSQWNSSTYRTMKSVSPIFNNAAPVDNYTDDPGKASMSMVTHVTNKLDRGTTVRPSDLTNDKFTKVHRYFSAEAYYTKSGLAALNASEEAKYRKYLQKAKKSDEDTYVNWINAMLPAHLHVNALTRDLSDGVVLLVVGKAKPGCVNWKKHEKSKA